MMRYTARPATGSQHRKKPAQGSLGRLFYFV
jgi:hypothetical protein